MNRSRAEQLELIYSTNTTGVTHPQSDMFSTSFSFLFLRLSAFLFRESSLFVFDS